MAGKKRTYAATGAGPAAAEEALATDVASAAPLRPVAASVRRLLDGALAAGAQDAEGGAWGTAGTTVLLAAAAETTSAEGAGATLALARVQAVLDRTWEQLNTGHWSAVPLEHRRIYSLASLHKVWLLLEQGRRDSEGGRGAKGAAGVLRAALAAADHGLLLGIPLPVPDEGGGGGCGVGGALAEAASALSRALALLDVPAVPAPDVATTVAGGTNKQEEFQPLSSISTIKPPPTSVHGQTVPTLHQPSLQRFASDYFFPRRPVHLEGAANHWPARQRWNSLEYLCRIAGARTVPVELGAHYVDPDWAQQLMTLDDFIKKHVKSHAQSTPPTSEHNSQHLGYLAQHPLFDQVPELRADICIPEYCCLSDDPEGMQEPDINAWFGPAGTVSPLHFDPKHNLLTQVVGSKHVFLYSPEASSMLYPHEGLLLNNTAQVDPEHPDYKCFPLFKEAEAWRCTLLPGDMLYIPPRWWHHVRSLSISFSVSFWWE